MTQFAKTIAVARIALLLVALISGFSSCGHRLVLWLPRLHPAAKQQHKGRSLPRSGWTHSRVLSARKDRVVSGRVREGFHLRTGQHSGMSAGRFDIGPEKLIPQRPQLWMGRWKGEITGTRSARLTSTEDKATGVQLTRDFVLAESGSVLKCTQTIKNISDKANEWCHWSRTFALGNGVCVIPLSPTSKFPNHYVMYEDGTTLNFAPEDQNIRRSGDFLVITGVPRKPKLGMDSMAGWFAYLMKNDLMFVKRFPTYPNRVYNEVAGLTISIWYPEDRRVELEPIGPRERLQPGESASFTETWELKHFPFPTSSTDIDPVRVSHVARG